MKTLIVSLLLLWMVVPSKAQITASATGVQSGAQTDGILQSIENGTIQAAGDHYLVTRKDSRSSVELIFKSCQGVGIHRELDQWWVLPIGTVGSQIEVNTNLW